MKKDTINIEKVLAESINYGAVNGKLKPRGLVTLQLTDNPDNNIVHDIIY